MRDGGGAPRVGDLGSSEGFVDRKIPERISLSGAVQPALDHKVGTVKTGSIVQPCRDALADVLCRYLVHINSAVELRCEFDL